MFITQNMTLSLPWDKVQVVKTQTQKWPHPLHAEVWWGCWAWQILLAWHYHWQDDIPATYRSGSVRITRLQMTCSMGWSQTQRESNSALVAHLQATAKLICKPLIKEVVTTDASKEDCGGHMNKLSFSGRWPVNKSRDIHISILELETVRMTCRKFEEAMSGKTISFQTDNTMAVAYPLKEVGTHCKTLNSLARKILLKCHKNGIMVWP